MTVRVRGVPIALILALGMTLALGGFMSGRADLLVAGLAVVGIGVVAGIVVVILRASGPGGDSSHGE